MIKLCRVITSVRLCLFIQGFHFFVVVFFFASVLGSISGLWQCLEFSSQLVSWCFKPSQPQRITSGLMEFSRKLYFEWSYVSICSSSCFFFPHEFEVFLFVQCAMSVCSDCFQSGNWDVRNRQEQTCGQHSVFHTHVKSRLLAKVCLIYYIWFWQLWDGCPASRFGP